MTTNDRIPRTIKPREPSCNADRPIIVIIDDMAMDENGELTTTSAAINRLRALPPHIVVTANESVSVLKRVTDMYGDNPHFNYRITPIVRDVFTGKERPGRRITQAHISVSFFGWHGEKRGRSNTVRNRYHLLIDPQTFSNKPLEERTHTVYMEWAREIRAFCIQQGWNLRPTQAGIARQALTDPRFYPEGRRKVPRATNDKVRSHLPGNHYQLADSVSTDREYEADYLDQTRCHHYHASTVGLPHPDHLNGFGYFRDPDCGREYLTDPDTVARFLDGFKGMVYGRIYWPFGKRKQTEFVPACLAGYNSDTLNTPIYFFSEDLPLFESLDVRVCSIIAGWGSKVEDTGIRTYAKWALNELERNGAPAWKKSLLLSTYGSLAVAPRKQTYAFHRSRKGERRTIRSAHGVEIVTSYHEASKESEPRTNNVLHRALIESSNRTETLLYAHYLESIGCRVLSVYVDALIVESVVEGDLPPMPAPWRHDEHLSHLRFLSSSQFASAQMLRLPGVTGAEHRQRVSMGTVRPSTGSQGYGRERLRNLAYEAWLDKREQAGPRTSTLDRASPEDRWAILQDVLGKESFSSALEQGPRLISMTSAEISRR